MSEESNYNRLFQICLNVGKSHKEARGLIEGLIEDRLTAENKELRDRVEELESLAQRWYNSDGSYSLHTKEEIIAKRKDAAKKLAQLTAKEEECERLRGIIVKIKELQSSISPTYRLATYALCEQALTKDKE